MTRRYRVGRKLGRTIYRQVGRGASDRDQFVGIFDSAEVAKRVVHLLNLDAELGHGKAGCIRPGKLCDCDEVDVTAATDEWQRVEMVCRRDAPRCRANPACQYPPNHTGACLIPGDERRATQ